MSKDVRIWGGSMSRVFIHSSRFIPALSRPGFQGLRLFGLCPGTAGNQALRHGLSAERRRIAQWRSTTPTLMRALSQSSKECECVRVAWIARLAWVPIPHLGRVSDTRLAIFPWRHHCGPSPQATLWEYQKRGTAQVGATKRESILGKREISEGSRWWPRSSAVSTRAADQLARPAELETVAVQGWAPSYRRIAGSLFLAPRPQGHICSRGGGCCREDSPERSRNHACKPGRRRIAAVQTGSTRAGHHNPAQRFVPADRRVLGLACAGHKRTDSLHQGPEKEARPHFIRGRQRQALSSSGQEPVSADRQAFGERTMRCRRERRSTRLQGSDCRAACIRGALLCPRAWAVCGCGRGRGASLSKRHGTPQYGAPALSGARACSADEALANLGPCKQKAHHRFTRPSIWRLGFPSAVRDPKHWQPPTPRIPGSRRQLPALCLRACTPMRRPMRQGRELRGGERGLARLAWRCRQGRDNRCQKWESVSRQLAPDYMICGVPRAR